MFHELSDHPILPAGGAQAELLPGGGGAVHHPADPERQHRRIGAGAGLQAVFAPYPPGADLRRRAVPKVRHGLSAELRPHAPGLCRDRRRRPGAAQGGGGGQPGAAAAAQADPRLPRGPSHGGGGGGGGEERRPAGGAPRGGDRPRHRRLPGGLPGHRRGGLLRGRDRAGPVRRSASGSLRRPDGPRTSAPWRRCPSS